MAINSVMTSSPEPMHNPHPAHREPVINVCDYTLVLSAVRRQSPDRAPDCTIIKACI